MGTVVRAAVTCRHARAKATRVRVIAGLVLDIAEGQRACGQVVLRRIRIARDHRALEVGVALDVDIEPAVTRLDPSLLKGAEGPIVTAEDSPVLRTPS